jgi:IS5 family transposase
MEKQLSFSDLEQGGLRRTRNQEFLATIDAVTPWAALVAAVEPFYPAGEKGRPPIGIERMLRITFAQDFLGYSDRAIEDALIENYTVRAFVGIDALTQAIPDFTTVCKFRKLLTENGLQRQFFNLVLRLLKEKGMLMREGKVVDATIIRTASSTKNKDKKRDPDAHSTKKGNNYHFGYKSHVAVDNQTGAIAAHITTPANTHDSNMANKLIGKHTRECHGDSGYLGISKRKDRKAHTKYTINERRSKVKTMNEEEKKAEKAKSSVRAKVEFAFHYLKNIFRYKGARYKGREKNDAHLSLMYVGINLYRLGRCTGQVCPST